MDSIKMVEFGIFAPSLKNGDDYLALIRVNGELAAFAKLRRRETGWVAIFDNPISVCKTDIINVELTRIRAATKWPSLI